VDGFIDLGSVLIVTGLVQEARIAAPVRDMFVICSSSDPRQLRALLAHAGSIDVYRGWSSSEFWSLYAGGPRSALKSGDVVAWWRPRFLGTAGHDRSGWPACVAERRADHQVVALRRRRVVRGPVSRGVEQLVAAAGLQGRVAPGTGRGLPSTWRAISQPLHTPAEAGTSIRALLRVISDPAGPRRLPALLARTAIKPNGEIDLRKVLSAPASRANSIDAALAGFDRDRL